MESPSGQQFGSSQMCLNGVPSSTDEVTGSAATTTNNAAAEPQQPPLHHHQHHQHPHQQQQQYHNQPPQPYLDHLEQQRHNNTNMRMSTCSSNDGSSSCPLTHQYHYIQYPAYYQLMNDRLQSQQQQQQQQEQELPPPTCRCPCSCGRPQGNLMAPNIPPTTNNSNSNSNTNALSGRHAHQLSDDSQMAVDVIVHRQAGGGGVVDNQQVGPGTTKSKSEQSLLDHSYQALQQGDLHSGYGDEEKQLNVAETTSCDCDLECTCEPALPAKSKPFGGGGGGAGPGGAGMSAMMLGADEITVSESDNNSATVNRKSRDALSGGKKSKPWCSRQDNLIGGGRGRKSSDDLYNSSQIDIYSDGDGDGDGDGTDSCLKMHNGGLSEDEQRPPLPPRPPPRPRNVIVNMNAHRNGTGIKKYVVWCLICGGFSCLLGVLFLGVYFLLHSYTITVGNFETVPTFVPATLLILTGLCIMSLARRRNRYSYLIKLSGACGLISALTCALVTVTTTVLHMSRLQALRECEYAQKTRTCTCYSDLIESQVERVDKEGVRLVFDSLSDCGVVHGSLYSCLRAIFGLSVAGVLIAVFSCMLVYQLLSHERKKMYWEQLELRCRSLYTSQQGPPPPNMAAMAGGRGNGCRCCEQCHAHRQVPLQPSAYPWDDGAEPRFWTGQPPGNFYSPNPGGDDLHNSGGAAPGGGCRGGHGLSNSRSRMTGWSWPRMPWQRSSPVNNTRFRQTPSSPDSQYGFSNSAPPPNEAAMGTDEMLAPTGVHPGPGGFNVVVPGNLPYGVWGPPPPYSDPNSPARRGYYHYVHPNAPCLGGQSDRQSVASSAEPHQARLVDCRPHRGPGQGPFLDSQSSANAHDAGFCGQASSMRNLGKRQSAVGGKVGFASKGSGGGDYENTPSDSDGGAARDRFSNTLPTRKLKKRVEAGAKSIGPNSHSHAPATQRVNVQHVFPGANCGNEGGGGGGGGNEDEHDYHEPMMNPNAMGGGVGGDNNLAQPTCLNGRAAGQRHQLGVENSGFQSSAECNTVEGHGHGHDHGGHVHGHGHGHENCDPAESEVYFADVSSCCNMSVKNDNYYEDANQPSQPPSVKHSNCHNHPSHSHSHNHNAGSNSSQSPAVAAAAVANDEDYLAQRFGKRENSIRSRLPFPQSCGDDYERNLNMATTAANGPAPSNGTITSPPSSSGPMQKEMSRQSMCSVESEAKTEFTDLSPSTPCTNKFAQVPFGAGMTGAAPPGPGYCNTTAGPTPGGHCEESATNNRLAPPTFIASSYPYSSESQSLEAHRRSTRNINEHMLAPEAQYEVINDAPAPGKAAMPSFPVSPSGRTAAKGNQRPTTLRTHNAQNVAKNGAKNVAAYQSDVEWSDSSSCPNDRQHL